MNVLFLTLVKIENLEDRGIYHDLLREFTNHGHHVTMVYPSERRDGESTKLIKANGFDILKVKTLNIQKTNKIEKGLATVLLEKQFLNAVKKYLSNIRFDLVLYSTPPITFTKVVDFVKKRDNAFAYLLLKDIFPQNAVDMLMMKKGGILHRYFVKKEKELYKVSDAIGCMSQANVDFVLKHNPEVNPEKLEINPNSILPVDFSFTDNEKRQIRQKYGIPEAKKVFVYGGNLGIPQGLDFLMECFDANTNPNVHFLIVGSGTEFSRIEAWARRRSAENLTLLSALPKNDYDILLNSCDSGLIFLNKNFTIPNFPSRLLSYLEMNLPVIAVTDKNTDIGNIIESADCGFKVISGDLKTFGKVVNLLAEDRKVHYRMAENASGLLYREYLAEKSYKLIENRIKSHVQTVL